MSDGGTPDVTIWLDPGKTTGFACWDHRARSFTSFETDDLVTVGSSVELLALVNDHDEAFQAAIGWERYIITPGNARHGSAEWSLEVIGVARYLALKHGLAILKPQTSSMMKVSTDARLKLVGWHKPGKAHANDAARHLLRCMLRAGTLPFSIWDKAFTEEVLDDD